MKHLLSAARLGVAAAALASAGCDSSRPGAGFTNPNAGSISDRDKAATRTDMPVPDSRSGEPIAEASRSSPSSTGSNDASGVGKLSSGSTDDARRVSPEAATSPPATPPKKENAGSAAGATKPEGSINTGTPRSPQ